MKLWKTFRKEREEIENLKAAVDLAVKFLRDSADMADKCGRGVQTITSFNLRSIALNIEWKAKGEKWQ